jgi:outer membrane protein TolC
VTTQVLQSLQDLQAAHLQVQTAQTQLEQAREVLEVVKVQYDLGLLTNLEYLDAQAGLERAQLGSLQAQYREVLGEYALRQSTGDRIWADAGASAAR